MRKTTVWMYRDFVNNGDFQLPTSSGDVIAGFLVPINSIVWGFPTKRFPAWESAVLDWHGVYPKKLCFLDDFFACL